MKMRIHVFIFSFVILCHALGFFWLYRMWENPLRSKKFQGGKIIVQTISLKPAILSANDTPAVSSPTQTLSKSKPIVSNPKKIEKPFKKKQSNPIPAPKKETKNSTKKNELIAQAREKLAKIAPTGDKFSGSSPIMEHLSAGEESYRAELAARLKLLLHLPEPGEVKLKLTLDRSGNFISMDIASKSNSRNMQYLEKILPSLTYPAFDNHFKGLSNYTFSITLSHTF
jgi:outer membrane biosynthesis protein TonB